MAMARRFGRCRDQALLSYEIDVDAQAGSKIVDVDSCPELETAAAASGDGRAADRSLTQLHMQNASPAMLRRQARQRRLETSINQKPSICADTTI
jgi:hypothetical protein